MRKKKYFSLFVIVTILLSMLNVPINTKAASGPNPCGSTNAFQGAKKVAVDKYDNLYVYSSNFIKKMDTVTGEIETIVDDLSVDMSGFVADSNGNIYYSKIEDNKSTIVKVDPNGNSTEVDGYDNRDIYTLAVDDNDNIYFNLSTTGIEENLYKIDAITGESSKVDNDSENYFYFEGVTAVANDIQGNVYILFFESYIKISEGNYSYGDDLINQTYEEKSGVAVDSSGNLYIPGNGNPSMKVSGLKKLTNSGEQPYIFQDVLEHSKSVSVDSENNFYVVDYNSSYGWIVKKVSENGEASIVGVQPPQDQAPVLVTQLEDQTANVSESVQFSVQAQSCSNNFTYEWYKDNVKIEGATGSTYSIENAQESDNGNYKVTVKNSAGEVSSSATLTVNDSTIKLDSIDEDTTDYEGTKTNVLSSDQYGTIITSADNTNGHWQYTDWSGNWLNLDVFSEEAGYILGSDVFIRFIPKKDWNGKAHIEYRKLTDWYLAGTEDGFPTDFSSLSDYYDPTKPTEKASITVLPVNDAPYLTDSDDDIGFTKDLETNQGISVYKMFKTKDVDGDVVNISEITSSNTDLVPVNNIEELFTAGDQNDKALKITPAAGKSGEATISVKVCNQPEDESPLCYESSFKVTVNNSASTETPGPTVTLEPYEVIKANEPWGVTINESSLYFVETKTKNIVKVSLADNTRKVIKTGIDQNTSALTGIAITGEDVYISNFNTLYKGNLSELENGTNGSFEVIKVLEGAEITGLTIDGQKEILYFADQNKGKLYSIPLNQLDEINSEILEQPWFNINPNSPTRYLRGITYYKGSIYGVNWDYEGGVYFYQVPILADGKAGNVLNIGDLPNAYTGSMLAGAPAIDDNGKVYITDMRSKVTMTTPSAPSVITNDDLNVINGADITMEYSDDNGLSWTSFNYTTIPIFSGNQTVLVRYKAVEGVSYASPSTTLSFTTNPPSNNRKPTVTTVTSSINPSKEGQMVRFTAITTATPSSSGELTGTVTFMDGNTVLETVELEPLGISNGKSKAVYSTSNLSVGSHMITAVYSGDSNFDIGTFEPFIQIVTEDNAGGGGTTPNPTPDPTPDPTPTPTPDPTPSPSPQPNEEQIVVDVDGNDGSNLTKTPITRTTETNGTVKDKVSMTDAIAKVTVEKAKEQGVDTARIIIPDKEDKVSEVLVEVPKNALDQLNKGKLKLEIETANAVISIPTTSISDFNQDLYFRVVPIKSESEKQQVEDRAKNEKLIQDEIGNNTVQVLGRPMEIETNMQSRQVSIVLPLTASLPANEAEREKILNNLGVYIEHSDSTKELIKGTVVKMADGSEGLQFTVNKFSTFTMVYLEGWEQNLTDQEHLPYINGYGTEFRPNASITRAEMAAMIARNINATSSTKRYADFLPTHWAYGEAIETIGAKIMVGTSATTFNPDGSMTRAQMATIAYNWVKNQCEQDANAFDCSKLSNIPNGGFTDVTSKHWAMESINFVKSSGIMVGYEDHTFKPNQKLTRAEAVKVLNDLLKRQPLKDVKTPTFKDVSTSHWAFEEIEEAATKHSKSLHTNH